MPALLRKSLISMGTAFLVMFIYMFFDPSLKEFIYSLFLSLYLMVFNLVVKFTFQKGVISFAAIAWKRIFFVGGFALLKRFGINAIKKNMIEHIVNPLAPAIKTWMVVHFNEFKEQPRWLQFSGTTLGIVVIGAVGYMVGILGSLWKLVEMVLTGKFQSFFLTIIGTLTKSLGLIWDKIRPWVDVIIMSTVINFIEKIPGIGAIFHKTKKMKDKAIEKKNQAIHAVVHKPVEGMVKIIQNHAKKKIQEQM